MAGQSDPDKLEEQAARIRHAEEEAGLKPAEPDPDTVDYRETAKGYRVGTDFAFTVLAFIAVGWVIDRALDIAPWGLLVMLLAGFGVGMMNLWRAVGRGANGANGQGKKE